MLFIDSPASFLQIVSAPTQIFGGQFGLISGNELGENRRVSGRKPEETEIATSVTLMA